MKTSKSVHETDFERDEKVRKPWRPPMIIQSVAASQTDAIVGHGSDTPGHSFIFSISHS
jgi:hypothetical protein